MHIHDFNCSNNDSYNSVPEDGYDYFDTPEIKKAIKLFMDEFSISNSDGNRYSEVNISW